MRRFNVASKYGDFVIKANDFYLTHKGLQETGDTYRFVLFEVRPDGKRRRGKEIKVAEISGVRYVVSLTVLGEYHPPRVCLDD